MKRFAPKPMSLAVLALFFLAVPGRASKVKTWHHCTTGHYDKAQLSHALITSEGGLRLSRQLKPLAATATWSWRPAARGRSSR